MELLDKDAHVIVNAEDVEGWSAIRVAHASGGI